MKHPINEDTTEEYRANETIALTEKAKIKTTVSAAILGIGFIVAGTLWCANVTAELSAIRKDITILTKQMDALYEPARLPAHVTNDHLHDQVKN